MNKKLVYCFVLVQEGTKRRLYDIQAFSYGEQWDAVREHVGCVCCSYSSPPTEYMSPEFVSLGSCMSEDRGLQAASVARRNPDRLC